MSLKSWCYHYPYSIYEHFVQDHLAGDGVMIVDVRRDQDQQAQIEKAFNLIDIAHRDHTLERLVLRRKS